VSARGATRALLAAAVAATALAVAGPAGAGGDDVGASIKIAKKKAGPYSPFLQDVNVPNSGRELFVRVKGDAANPGPVELRFGDDGSTSGVDGWKVKWFKHGDNISAEVKNEGYQFKVGPGQRKYFAARITPDDPSNGFCLEAVAIEGFVSAEGTFAGIETACSV
jgi:hypothetical protein